VSHDDSFPIISDSQVRMSGDVLLLMSRVARLEAVMFGPGEDEAGGLRAQIASLAVKLDKETTIINAKMDQMTWWFRFGAMCIVIFLALFGPPQVQEVIRMIKGVAH
jgi:hypothetical protein